MNLHFRDPKKELPKEYETVFVRTVDNFYYFAYRLPNEKWFPDDNAEVSFSINVIGWIPLTELDLIEIK